MRLENKVAIVTGAASGIGLGIAKRFVEEGAKVVFSDVNETDVSAYGDKAIFVKTDVSDSAQVDALVKSAVEKFGRLDIMVNNAGIASMGSVSETTNETWQKVISIDLNGVFYGIRAAAKYMSENKIAGSIINTASIAGLVGFQGADAYCASKGGVIQLTRTAALDLAASSIRVNAIAPGIIETAMTKDYLADPTMSTVFKQSTPLPRIGQPEDIANGALYLASDESSFVTGTVLVIDGGWTVK